MRTIPFGGLQLTEPERCGECADGVACGTDIQLEAAGEPGIGGETAEQEVGVGDGRLRAAASIAGGPGSAPAERGPTRRAPPVVAPAHRASAGAYRVDVDHG